MLEERKLDNRIMIKAILNIVVAIFVLLLIVWILPWFLTFFKPIIIGGLIAFCANPLVKLLEKTLKIKRKFVTALVAIFALTLVCLFFYGTFTLLQEQAIGLVSSVPSALDNVKTELWNTRQSMDGFAGDLVEQLLGVIDGLDENIDDYVMGALSMLSTPTMEALGSFAKSLPTVIINTIMGILAAYFFIIDREFVSQFVSHHTSNAVKKYSLLMYHNLIGSLIGYLKSQVKIEIFMYFFLLIGLLILGIPYAAIIALGMACLDILPVFGTGITLGPWALVEFLSGDFKTCIGLLLIWWFGQLFRQMIQPKIMGDTIGIPPIPTIILLYIGYHVQGVIGMILALPIGIIIIRLNQEGVFDQTKHSLQLFVKLLNDMRRLGKEDLVYLDSDEDNDKRK